MSYHRCQCGYETDVSKENLVFDNEIHCRQCGLSASESDAKISSELTSMMEGFNIDTIRNQSQAVSIPSTPQVMPQQPSVAYITQHYTHSAHVVPQQYSEPSVCDALAAAGINATALLPSQIQLFRHAQPDQQARLIELWRIAPPNYGNHLMVKHLWEWPSTSFEMEEDAARVRWERAEQEKVKNLCGPQDLAEPYIVNGYHSAGLIYGTNPTVQHGESESGQRVAKSSGNMDREWWRVSEQPMEHQYGMLQQMRMQGFQLDAQDEEML